MNAPQVELGQQLRAFKESTKTLSAPLRGYRIGSAAFIRAAHNSFLRRMDQLNADLYLANEAQDGGKVRKIAKTASPKKGPVRHRHFPSMESKKRKKKSLDFGFHFVAYVHAGGLVWELDGMKDKPRRIGRISNAPKPLTTSIGLTPSLSLL